MTSFVLDSSVVLAVIYDEPDAESLLVFLQDAIISAVNYAEVMTKLIDKGLSRERARQAVVRTGVRIIPFSVDVAERTGELVAQTRELGLSLGDRACLALAEREGRPAVSADRAWRSLKIGIEIQLVR